jgi:hypothetical protein
MKKITLKDILYKKVNKKKKVSKRKTNRNLLKQVSKVQGIFYSYYRLKSGLT